MITIGAIIKVIAMYMLFKILITNIIMGTSDDIREEIMGLSHSITGMHGNYSMLKITSYCLLLLCCVVQ